MSSHCNQKKCAKVSDSDQCYHSSTPKAIVGFNGDKEIGKRIKTETLMDEMLLIPTSWSEWEWSSYKAHLWNQPLPTMERYPRRVKGKQHLQRFRLLVIFKAHLVFNHLTALCLNERVKTLCMPASGVEYQLDGRYRYHLFRSLRLNLIAYSSLGDVIRIETL